MKKYISDKVQKWLNTSLENCLQNYFSSLSTVHILQIGANDGNNLDPVKNILENYPSKAILVEPVGYLVDQLKQKYDADKRVEVLRVAISPLDSEDFLPFYYFKEKEGIAFNPDYSLWGSFSKDHIEKFRPHVAFFDDLLTCENVPVLSINALLASSKYTAVDYLQIDAEGWDARLVNAIDFERYKPLLIRFEHTHTDKVFLFQVLAKLSSVGYQTFSLGMDTVCITGSATIYFSKLRMVKNLYPNWLMPAK